MMMYGQLVIPLLAGSLLGGVFFGGLWLTVTRGLRSPAAGLWFLLSNLARTAFVLAGFYVMAKEGLAELTTCLIGFLCARLAVGRLLALPTILIGKSRRSLTAESDPDRTVADGWFVPSREPVGDAKPAGGTNHPPATAQKGRGTNRDLEHAEEPF